MTRPRLTTDQRIALEILLAGERDGVAVYTSAGSSAVLRRIGGPTAASLVRHGLAERDRDSPRLVTLTDAGREVIA